MIYSEVAISDLPVYYVQAIFVAHCAIFISARKVMPS